MTTMTTVELMTRLRRHYIKPGPMPGGVFVPECGRNGGTGAGSRCDALYIGFTSTSGRMLIGHEVKVSRSDWLRELDKAGKADQWADDCHQWWIVAPSVDIVPAAEVPPGWGLMVVDPKTKTRLRKVVAATTHADRQPSWHTVRSIVARLDTLQEAERRTMRADMEPSIRAEVEKRAREREAVGLDHGTREALALMANLEDALGVKLAGYNHPGQATPERVAMVLRLLDTAEKLHGWRGVRDTAAQLEETARNLRAFETELQPFREAVMR